MAAVHIDQGTRGLQTFSQLHSKLCENGVKRAGKWPHNLKLLGKKNHFEYVANEHEAEFMRLTSRGVR